MFPSLINEYRIAISLNNLGIALQERGCEMQALATFQDGVSVMKSITRPPQAERSSDLMLYQAIQRLSNPSTSKGLSPMLFSCVSDDADSSVALQATISASHSTLVRIEEYGVESTTQRDLDLDCAILLHNFGLSCLLYSYSAPGYNTSKLQRNALKLLSLAQTIISNTAARSDDDDELVEKILFLSMISTHSMMQACLITAQAESKIKQCFTQLEDLKHTLETLNCFNPVHRDMVAAAA